MSLIKVIVAAIGMLVIILAGGAYLMPDHVAFTRIITINAPPEKVFALVTDLKRRPEWSPWASLDPATKFSFSGPAIGKGAQLDWASNDPSVGKGSETVTRYDAPRFAVTELNFGEMGKSTSSWQVEPDGQKTKLIWGFSAKLDNVIDRWMGPLMERAIAPEYEQGLKNLKTVAEKEAGTFVPSTQPPVIPAQ